MDSLPKNKPPTFSSLYEIKVANAANTGKRGLKADNIGQQFKDLWNMKPSVNLNDILQHELLPLPLALAEMGGSFRTETKSILADVLLKEVQ